MAREKKEEESGPDGSAWLGTYGDLITLLMCFFVLLFAMSNVDSAKFSALAAALSSSSDSLLDGGGAAGLSDMLGNGIMEMPVVESTDTDADGVQKDKADFQQMASDFKTYFAENNMAEQIVVQVNEDSIDITFKDAILFDSGSASVKEDGLTALDFIGNEIIKYPNMLIEIYGHTDNVPIKTAAYPDNWFLSAARAINVSYFFINQKGFSPQSVLPIGRGEFMPIAPNDTPVNRAKNRRVEIRIREDKEASGFF